MGYSEPTPIQLRSAPLILAGRDLIASAQTGTGKTAAFALPVLSMLDHPEPRIRCLVLEPTRELAMQVETAFRDYMRFMHTEVSLIHGGVGYGKQRDDLKRQCDVIVATPGRLIDHIQQGLVDLSSLKFLILDEVDRMLDMGFLPDVRRIIEHCPKERQTLLFSATVPEEIERLSSWCLKDPERIEIGARRSPAETVSHALYPVAQDQKFDLLLALLERTNYDSVLIFPARKMAPTAFRANSRRRTTPSPPCIPTAPRPSASRPSKVSKAANMKSWSRPTSPHAESISRGSAMW